MRIVARSLVAARSAAAAAPLPLLRCAPRLPLLLVPARRVIVPPTDPNRLKTPAQPGNIPPREGTEPQQYDDAPFDVPIGEQAKEVAGELTEVAKEKLHELADKAKRLGKKAKGKMNDSLHHPRDDDPNIRGIHSNAGGPDSEGPESAAHRLKKGARRVKDALKEATGTSQPTSRSPASSAFSEEDFDSASEDVRAAAKSSQLSTSAGRLGTLSDLPGFKAPPDADEVAGYTTEEVDAMENEYMDAHSGLKKSIVQGPQEMPQGPGKRARDPKGQPMETGARGT